VSRMKYIRFKDAGIVIFENQIEHSSMGGMFPNDTPISAGFFNVQDADEVSLYGKSVSLDLATNESDLPRLKRNLRGY
jgi:hypothetical protein